MYREREKKKPQASLNRLTGVGVRIKNECKGETLRQIVGNVDIRDFSLPGCSTQLTPVVKSFRKGTRREVVRLERKYSDKRKYGQSGVS